MSDYIKPFGVKVLSVKYFNFLPIAGLLVYVILYSYAVSNYPGGSVSYPNSSTYSFSHNLLCDAMDLKTPNGTLNASRPLAVVAHVVLSVSMILFFIILPKLFAKQNLNTMLMRLCGVLSITALVFLFTSYHDPLVVVTAIFGVLAMTPFFLELKTIKNKSYKILVYIGVSLSILVFLSFISNIGRFYLPLLQKVSFFIDAIWIGWTCLIITRQTH